MKLSRAGNLIKVHNNIRSAIDVSPMVSECNPIVGFFERFRLRKSMFLLLHLATTLDFGKTLTLRFFERLLLGRCHSRALPNDIRARSVRMRVVRPNEGSLVPHLFHGIPNHFVVQLFLHRLYFRHDSGRRRRHTVPVPIKSLAIDAVFLVELELLLRNVVRRVKWTFDVLQVPVIFAALGQMGLHPELHYLVRPIVRTFH